MNPEEKDKKELEKTNNLNNNTGENNEEVKTPTISDWLSEQRKAAQEAKTSAANMKKYYALSDAFKALGKMGGAVVGGALQGNNLWGNAPTVAEQQPSRGYIQAFENAKDASKRIQSLDDMAFQLAVKEDERKHNAKMIQEERDYKDKVSAAEQEYNTEMLNAKNNWDKDFFLYKTQIEQANAQGNMKLANELKMQLQKAQEEHELKVLDIRNAFQTAMKNANLAIVDKQTSPKADTPLAFNDGTSALIPSSIYNKMAEHFEGSDWNGGKVTKYNVLKFIEENPKIANDYLNRFGYGVQQPATTTVPTTTVPAATGQTAGQDGKFGYTYNPHVQGVPYNYVELPTDAESKWGGNVVK